MSTNAGTLGKIDTWEETIGGLASGFAAAACAVMWWSVDMLSTFRWSAVYLPMLGDSERWWFTVLPTALEMAIALNKRARVRYAWVLWPLAGWDWYTDWAVVSPPFLDPVTAPADTYWVNMVLSVLYSGVGSFGFQAGMIAFAKIALENLPSLPPTLRGIWRHVAALLTWEPGGSKSASVGNAAGFLIVVALVAGFLWLRSQGLQVADFLPSSQAVLQEVTNGR